VPLALEKWLLRKRKKRRSAGLSSGKGGRQKDHIKEIKKIFETKKFKRKL
jgi:hypothetical protein